MQQWEQNDRYLGQFGQPTGFYIGLDLGMARDFSAIVISEKRTPMWADCQRPFSVVRWAHRFKLGMKYGDIAREVAAIIDQLPPRPEPFRLFADSTGVGRPVCDQLRDEGLRPYDVTLTGGTNWSWEGSRISLPKAMLASRLNVEFQNQTIVIAGGLPWRDQITKELECFRVSRSDAGNDLFGSRTAADHDDFVIALGLAVWGATSVTAPKPILMSMKWR
jgi:hypothetical protein